MLNIFRRIRKTLIESGFARKYVLYAIGEILLVMIGILLALQVNNWNEAKKNKREESYYLQELYNDFQVNKEMLKVGEADILQKLEGIENTRSFLNRPFPANNSPYDVIWYYYGLSVPDLEFAEEALNELLNTGKLYLISNRQLRKDLSNWKGKVDIAQTHVSKILKFREQELRPFMIDCCPMGHEFRDKHIDALSDYRFGTLLELYKLMLNTQLKLKRDPIEELIDDILYQIETELSL